MLQYHLKVPGWTSNYLRLFNCVLQECPAGVEPASPAWKAGTSAARPRARTAEREGVEPSRLFSASRDAQRIHGRLARVTLSVASASKGSTVFETAAIAHWLALPLRAAVTGIEPVSVCLTGACPYQHGPHRNRVSAVGFEPTICRRGDRNCQAFPYAECKSAQRESNPHIRHGKADQLASCQSVPAAATSWALALLLIQLSKNNQSTGSDSNRRRRITGAESWPLDDQCFVFSGTRGIRTLTSGG